jgi:outer membrane protein
MEKKSIIIYLSLLLMLPWSQSIAQEKLTLEEAISIALENNFDIRLVSNDLAINKNNANNAIAALLPSATGSFSTNNSLQNARQIQASGVENHIDGAKNTSLNYGVSLNWTVFDGFGMFAAYNGLKELQKLGEANLKATVLSTVFNVINGYYNIARQQQELQSTVTAVEISRLRLNNSQNRYTLGKASKLEVLAAEVDLNTDTTNLLRQVDLLNVAKIQLNQLIARDAQVRYEVSDSIEINKTLKLNELSALVENQNPSLQAAVINQRLAELNLKQVKAARYPTVALNTGYNFFENTSELGFARQSNGRGFNYGVTASVNIFNGFLQNRNEKNANIEIESSKLQYDKLRQQIDAQLVSAFQTYLTRLELVNLESKNQDVAKQNLDITMEKFKLGSITPLEFREAQRNYVDASVRYADAQYEAKLAETSLQQIAGNIKL